MCCVFPSAVYDDNLKYTYMQIYFVKILDRLYAELTRHVICEQYLLKSICVCVMVTVSGFIYMV